MAVFRDHEVPRSLERNDFLHDISFRRTSSKATAFSYTIPFVQKLEHGTEKTCPSKKKRSVSPLNTKQGPIRQYYHSKHIIPMKTTEWDMDSDDESDDDWLHDTNKEVRFRIILFSFSPYKRSRTKS